MLYVISGASRSGKTLIAKKISEQKGILYLSLDWIMMGFTNGIPEYGVHDKLMPDDIAKRLWRFLKAMFESMIFVGTDCVIEGEAISPALITELLQKYPDQFTICFLGFTEVGLDKKSKEIRKYTHEQNDWLKDKSEAYIKDHIKNMIEHSRYIKKSCKENNIRYFDTSKNFSKTLQDAIKYLSA